MIVDPKNGDRGHLADYNGEEIRDALWADTSTGEVIVAVRGGDGSYLIDKVSRCAVTEKKRFRAPLRFSRT